MAVRDATPNNPKKAETNNVNTLMGMCRPIEPANTLKKNKNKTPIPILTIACPMKCIGFTGAPIQSKITIKATIIPITIPELMRNPPLSFISSLYNNRYG